MAGFAEFTIGPAEGRTRWLNPPYIVKPQLRRSSTPTFLFTKRSV